jgi:hypothetical protein
MAGARHVPEQAATKLCLVERLLLSWAWPSFGCEPHQHAVLKRCTAVASRHNENQAHDLLERTRSVLFGPYMATRRRR